MRNLTVLYYTANRIPEVFAERVRKHLRSVVGGLPILSVSQHPVDLGRNICVGEIGFSLTNLYTQLLVGAERVQTDFVVMAEDDVLYTEAHFAEYELEQDGLFHYDMNKWGAMAWRHTPRFTCSNRLVLNQMVCHRDLLIDTARERLKIDLSQCDPGDVFIEPGRYRKCCRGVRRHAKIFNSSGKPSVVIEHFYGLAGQGQNVRKRMPPLRADVLDGWGSVDDVLLNYLGAEEVSKQQRLADELWALSQLKRSEKTV